MIYASNHIYETPKNKLIKSTFKVFSVLMVNFDCEK